LSRPRSGRAASSGGGGGSRPAARPGVFVQTPKSDIYVTLLGIALGAMILGCLLLVLILNSYEFKTKVSALTAPRSTSLALASTRAAENAWAVRL
jgi:hypothetical protein